jgi:hypothetical protein
MELLVGNSAFEFNLDGIYLSYCEKDAIRLIRQQKIHELNGGTMGSDFISSLDESYYCLDTIIWSPYQYLHNYLIKSDIERDKCDSHIDITDHLNNPRFYFHSGYTYILLNNGFGFSVQLSFIKNIIKKFNINSRVIEGNMNFIIKNEDLIPNNKDTASVTKYNLNGTVKNIFYIPGRIYQYPKTSKYYLCLTKETFLYMSDEPNNLNRLVDFVSNCTIKRVKDHTKRLYIWQVFEKTEPVRLAPIDYIATNVTVRLVEVDCEVDNLSVVVYS